MLRDPRYQSNLRSRAWESICAFLALSNLWGYLLRIRHCRRASGRPSSDLSICSACRSTHSMWYLTGTCQRFSPRRKTLGSTSSSPWRSEWSPCSTRWRWSPHAAECWLGLSWSRAPDTSTRRPRTRWSARRGSHGTWGSLGTSRPCRTCPTLPRGEARHPVWCNNCCGWTNIYCFAWTRSSV